MERHRDEGITIRELAELAGTTTRTIHYYASEGLLPPPQGVKRGATYTAAHLARLRLIAALRDEGLSLAAIRNRLAPLDDTQVLAVIEDINVRPGDEEASAAPLTTLGAIEAALSARLSTATDTPDLLMASHEPAREEGNARMDTPSPANAIVPPPSPSSAPSALPRRRERIDALSSQAPQPPRSESARDYIDRIRGSEATNPSTSRNPTVPPRRVPPARPLPQPRGTTTETPEAWYHFRIGDGIELRVREDRYREAGGRLRAIVDATTSAARRYGLSPSDDPGQSTPD